MYHSIFADKVTDCGMKKQQQMTLFERLVNNNKIIRKEFRNFLNCKNGLNCVGSGWER